LEQNKSAGRNAVVVVVGYFLVYNHSQLLSTELIWWSLNCCCFACLFVDALCFMAVLGTCWGGGCRYAIAAHPYGVIIYLLFQRHASSSLAATSSRSLNSKNKRQLFSDTFVCSQHFFLDN
jgi:hypothetical protein